MINIRDSKVKYCIVIAAVFSLSGCKLTENFTSSEKPETNGEQAEVRKVPKELSTKQRFVKAIEHLEFGREQEAIVQLQAYLTKVPKSRNAKELMAQIKTDSADYFPNESFSVNLESGESLSTLSRKYLGSALKFYALAKYNDIKNPSRVNVGQEIKIPLTDKAVAVRTAEQNPQPQEVVVEQEAMEEKKVESSTVADSAVSEMMTQEIAEEIDSLPSEEMVAQETQEVVTADSLINEIVTAIEQNDYQTAAQKVRQLEGFGALTSETRSLAITALTGYAKELAETDTKQASARYSEAGDMNLMNGESMAALSNFKIAADLDPENAIAIENRDVLQKDMADKFHREASSAFRRQDLDVAIKNWNKVLEIDPQHSSARVYLEQAKELKTRLENLNN